MSIDCEGEDLAVLKGLDFKRYQPRLLCVESDDDTRERYASLLRGMGYGYHAHTKANTLFKRER